MIEHYLKSFSIRPHMGVKEYCMYTTASKESCNLRTTHSSFWLLLNKTKIPINKEDFTTALVLNNSPQQVLNETECTSTSYKFSNKEKATNEELNNQQQQALQIEEIFKKEENKEQQEQQEFTNIKAEQK